MLHSTSKSAGQIRGSCLVIKGAVYSTLVNFLRFACEKYLGKNSWKIFFLGKIVETSFLGKNR